MSLYSQPNTNLPGIGIVTGEKLTNQGYSTIGSLLDKYVELGKSKRDFSAWLKQTAGFMTYYASSCGDQLERLYLEQYPPSGAGRRSTTSSSSQTPWKSQNSSSGYNSEREESYSSRPQLPVRRILYEEDSPRMQQIRKPLATSTNRGAISEFQLIRVSRDEFKQLVKEEVDAVTRLVKDEVDAVTKVQNATIQELNQLLKMSIKEVNSLADQVKKLNLRLERIVGENYEFKNEVKYLKDAINRKASYIL